MLTDTLLIAGWFFVLILSTGQLFIRRQNSPNKVLFSLFLVCCVWISHAVFFRAGMVQIYPHFNKAYLPLLCITGPLWYLYLKSLFDSTSANVFDKKILWPPALCFFLAIPFYLQSGDYKRSYIEVNIADFPSLMMYAATRFAELTLIWFFVSSLRFLSKKNKHTEAVRNRPTTKLLWILTAVALFASIVRLVGSILGNHTISVLFPTLLSLGVFVCMHLMSYRVPALLGLDLRGARQIKSLPESDSVIEQYGKKIRDHKWFLDPDLKIRDLARKLGQPTNDLSAVINQGTGKNYNEYINTFRIDHAKMLLLEKSSMSVMDIALASGFNSKSVFYENFTSFTGTTPSKYRKSSHGEKLSDEDSSLSVAADEHRQLIE